MTDSIRVLLVPDSIYWVTGTIASSFARYNPWMRAAIVSGPVLDEITQSDPGFPDRFDFIHFVCPYAALNWLDRLKSRVPVVTSHHHVTDWELVKHNLRGDCIVAGSTEWARDIIARGADPARVVCIPYGVDAERFAPPSPGMREETRRRLGLRDDGPVIGFFGKRGSNDDDRKGTDVFVHSIVELSTLLPHTQVVIVGPGWHQLVNELDRKGVKCAWIPFAASLDELAPIHGALDFYWVAARIEGGPVPLLEAMSTGVACLTTPVGLARDIVDGENAVMLEKGIGAPFAEVTAEIWRDSARRAAMGRRARQTILDRMRDADTSRDVYRAYEIASAHFAARAPGHRPLSIDRAALEQASPTAPNRAGVIPLEGIPASRQRQIQMLESLAWAENLVLYQQQRGPALSLIWKAWRANPTSLQPPRALLRRFLPTTVVKGIVSVKHRLAPRSHSPPASEKVITRS